jgi:hypothetical protein
MNATRLRSPDRPLSGGRPCRRRSSSKRLCAQENEQLRTALATRIVIEQAKGMLAERFEMDVDEAFERLRHQARSHRIKLHVLAAAVTAREAWAEAIVRPAEPRKPHDAVLHRKRRRPSTMGQNGLSTRARSEQRLRVLPLSQPSTHTTLKGRNHDVNSRNN